MNRIFFKGNRGKGKFTLVDDDDFDYLNQFNWHLTDSGYARRCESIVIIPKIYSSKSYRMSRVVMGVTDRNIKVDHINHNKIDNRKVNLRLCTVTQNLGNMVSKLGTSKYKGVYWEPSRNKWVVRVHHNYKQTFIGRFDLEDEAGRAYDRVAIKHFGEFANTNFPREDYA